MPARSLLVLVLFSLGCSAKAPPAPQTSPNPAVTLTYLGTAGWQLNDGDKTLLVDPYFTRHAENDKPVVPDEDLIARYSPHAVDGVLIGHSHYDHLLDAPSIVKKTGARLAGTDSALNVARAAGVAESAFIPVRGGETFTIGPFSVHAVRGLHSITGAPTANIEPGVTLPMKPSEYAVGDTIHYLVTVEGRRILFIGTANFIESELSDLRPSIAIIATALREKVPDYSCRLMKALGRPKLVFANHFDAHWERLGPKQMDLDPDERASLDHFAEEVHACSPETTVIIPQHFRSMPI